MPACCTRTSILTGFMKTPDCFNLFYDIVDHICIFCSWFTAQKRNYMKQFYHLCTQKYNFQKYIEPYSHDLDERVCRALEQKVFHGVSTQKPCVILINMKLNFPCPYFDRPKPWSLPRMKANAIDGYLTISSAMLHIENDQICV